MSTAPRARFYVGPSGWSYDDWAGIVYPARRPRGFRPLSHIARLFNAVEVNSSFYRTPTPRTTAGWVEQTPAEFRFTFKLHQAFTHARTAFPEPAEVEAVLAALRPVKEAGRLGPLLIQFPWSLRHGAAAVEWLKRLAETFAEVPRVVEVRHRSWATDEARAALRLVGGCCNIDQPALRDCLGPSADVFGEVAYARLHGRNAANWFAENIPGYERYNYLYSDRELAEWAERLRAMAQEAREVYVFANNHYKGQGVANALELREMLGAPRVEVPAELRAAYPRLGAISAPPRQAGLFGE